MFLCYHFILTCSGLRTPKYTKRYPKLDEITFLAFLLSMKNQMLHKTNVSKVPYWISLSSCWYAGTVLTPHILTKSSTAQLSTHSSKALTSHSSL